MTTMKKFGTALGAVCVLALGACGTTMNDPGNTSSSTTSSQSVYAANAYAGYGVVQAIDLVQQGSTASTGIGGSGIGIGTIAGAVIGGVLGNQVGSGTGRTVATVAGAAGGGYVGNQVENRQQQRTADTYRFTIRMDNGNDQFMTHASTGGFRVGDRVRIENGYLQRG